MNDNRETLGSRLGFLLLAAGCAIGMGNVWRFPYITGKFGGAIFLLFYLIFLFILGFPVMVSELAIGRGGRANLANSYENLKSPTTKVPWKFLGKLGIFGNLVLLMFYTVVTGWLLNYTVMFASDTFSQLDISQIDTLFGSVLASPDTMIVYTAIVVVLSTITCAGGLQSGLERVTKYMMIGLFTIMIGLVGVALSLNGSREGVSFFLLPSIENYKSGGGLFPVINAAMNQAFFTLSLGIGSIAIFGSYINKEHSLAKESFVIIMLDTFVAVCAGLIIFPCCYAFNVKPDAGPSLIFITLPKIFKDMPLGNLWGTLFFVFMTIAALTTLMAVLENLAAFGIDEFKLSRPRSSIISGIIVFICSLPCIYGFNYLSGFEPFGPGSCVLDLEDFIVSNNLLPLGALCICLFCSLKCGWKNQGFMDEVNAGNGLKLSGFFAAYVKFILPIIILIIWIIGIKDKFF